MAKDYKREDILYPDQKIIQSELVHEMQTSYIEYAMSVIVGRALPDVRDGLKPVHRRILYAMYEDNLTSDKPFKKSATCVGDVLGRYHPHGDASVYDAMVRLAQDFSMRYMLVDGHGNFGSVDGDPPAAYRYTEARLSKIANEMLRDIDKDTVDWDPNFDETRREPRVLPCRFPNLLVNGSSGIAVGMATNIPPHNLTEVINACVCVLENPDATLADLMQHVTGPDFPTRGIIVGRSGIRAAYATGRGRIVVRARTETETWGHDRIRIIVTELPYQVNKRQLIQNISEQVRDKKLDGISGLRDESDRNGMRIVIELKKDANTQVVLNRLFAQTQMQTTFAVNMLALVDNQSQPKILSLRHILDEYLTFQEEIIVRRTKFDLKKALERAHLLEGLLIAEENIDEVIRLIRSSYDDAREKLMERFALDEIQAQAICDMRLIALQGLNREKLEAEYKELEQKILGAEERIAAIESRIFNELIETAVRYIPAIMRDAQEAAGLDCDLSAATAAIDNHYVRPAVDDSLELDITDGRHPVIEQMLPPGEMYVANSVRLDTERQQIMVITGPNMSGKSALLRQTALIALMAQAGQFVPARSARVGAVDKIFTRVGASDNISRGESTFMVEMTEAASILNNMSRRSLILFDELGRGTSTYDGISIAWAIVENIHENGACRPRTLFATHYHELNEMEKSFPRVVNYNVAVSEHDGKVLFLRKLEKGGSAHSFGIHVARIAGIPPSIVKRAGEVLRELESTSRQESKESESDPAKPDMAGLGKRREGYQTSIFQLDDPLLGQIRDRILGLDIDNLTPIQALTTLHGLKSLLTGKPEQR